MKLDAALLNTQTKLINVDVGGKEAENVATRRPWQFWGNLHASQTRKGMLKLFLEKLTVKQLAHS